MKSLTNHSETHSLSGIHRSWCDGIISWSLVFGFSLFYFLLRTRCHTYDSLVYVGNALQLPWHNQFHPHHLLYHQLVFGIKQIRSLLHFPGTDVFWPFVIPSALFGGLTTQMVWSIARQYSGRVIAVITAIGTGMSFSLVFMSTNVEKYSIAAYCLLRAFNILINRDPGNPRTPVILALWNWAAVCIHQACLLFGLVPVIYWLILGIRHKRTLRCAGIYCLILATLSAGAYFIVMCIFFQGISYEMLEWPTRYIHDGSWGYGFTDMPYNWVLGHLSMFTGDNLSRLIQKHQPLEPAILEIIFAGLYAVSWIVALISIPRIKTRKLAALAASLGIWIVSYAVFIVWWEPFNTKVAVLYLPAIWLFFALTMGQERKPDSHRNWLWIIPTILTGLLLAINIPWTIWQHQPETNYDNRTAIRIAELTKPNDIILVPHYRTMHLYLTRFLERPNTLTLWKADAIASDPETFRDIIRTTMLRMCDEHDDYQFFITGSSCDPNSPTQLTHVSNNEVRSIMLPYLEYTDIVAKLPNGDRLFRMDFSKYCPSENRDTNRSSQIPKHRIDRTDR